MSCVLCELCTVQSERGYGCAVCDVQRETIADVSEQTVARVI